MTKYTLYCMCAKCGQEREMHTDFTKRFGHLLYLYCKKCEKLSLHRVFHWKHNSIKM